ncbi:MAG: DUF86 domain-containing protein [Lachnospiraceae bacterium]|nr:DUF86 domain-containing protein [Lachnospiraceae bacterium]
MNNRDRDVLDKIIRYCDDIAHLMNEYNYDYREYVEQISFQYSCNMCIIQIGELVGRLSEDFRFEHDDIPWHAIKSMRNLHAHDYERVDLEIVWDTLLNEIPELKEKLKQML